MRPEEESRHFDINEKPCNSTVTGLFPFPTDGPKRGMAATTDDSLNLG